MNTHRCKSYLAKAKVSKPEPSLAGVTVMWGLKRRQALCGVRKISLERQFQVTQAESIGLAEGNRVFPTSQGSSLRRGPRTHHAQKAVMGTWETLPGPTGKTIPVGGLGQRKTVALIRAEAGSLIGS